MAKEAAPTLDRLSSINVDGSRKHPHPADVKGRFVTLRRWVYLALLVVYVALPFVQVGGHPALQLDIDARRFYLFGAVFNAQDFWRVVFLVLTAGLALIFATTWRGRVWCGWACPQTVFLEGVYRRIERAIDGPREARIRLERAPLGAEKVLKRTGKHVAFALVSLAIAHVFLALFVSIPGLYQMVRHDPREHWEAFLWMSAITGALYFNFAWFREQLCVVVCPYGRLQSALLDRDSIVIGYDEKRGEPRGRITRQQRQAQQPLVQLKVHAPAPAPAAEPAPVDGPLAALSAAARAATVSAEPPAVAGAASAAPRKGDCVDCLRCVHVCPTGIDIRNGQQLECIGCAQCIDACDDVMTRLGREKGLIRYDSLAGLDGEKRQVMRPRLVVYGAALSAAVLSLTLVLATRTHFEANLLRLQGAPYVLDAGSVRNQYELHLVNKNAVDTVFHVEVSGAAGMQVTLPEKDVRLGSLEHFRLPIFISVPSAQWKGPFEVKLQVSDAASHDTREVTARFLGPPAGSFQALR